MDRRTFLTRGSTAMLGLSAGEIVLDVACGTGLSIPLLAAAVGPAGRVIGVEVSPAMIEQARDRVARSGLANVTLIEASMEEAALAGPLDAVLFNYTHDVLQSPKALRNVFSATRPGARIAIAGIKHPPAWLFPLRLYRLIKARPYVTTFRGLDEPWRMLREYVPDLAVKPVMLGTNYVASGRARR